jgi:hypothetical protein
MRCLVPAIFVHCLFASIGDASAVPAQPAPASGPRSPKSAARLGFRFDQEAHDAAAKNAPGTSIFLEPAEADVLRLPNYEVIEDPVNIREHRILTPKGWVELAKKRYLAPGYQKTLGQLMAVPTFLNNPLGGWSPNAPEALAIYADFEALRRKKEMAELTGLARFAEKAKNSKTQKPREKSKRSRKR